MRNLLKTGLVLIAATVCVALAGAQVGGGGRGGFGGQRGGGRNNSEIGLAMRKDVQTDLGLSDDQKTKLTELSDKQRAARRAGGQGGGGGAAADPEARAKAMEEQRAQAHKDLAAILTDAQMTRLGEISIQLQGNRAILNPTTQKALGLSEDQITKIKDLNAKMQEANNGLRAKVGNNEITAEEAAAARQKNNTTMNDELGKVLTADQAAKLKTMGGKPFVADPAPTPGG